LPPTARLLPFRVRVAAEPTNATVPRTVRPTEKVTLPVGAAVPDVALTVAVIFVDAVDAMLVGLAATDVVVVTVGALTVTVTELLELEKFPVAV
jgi:hypothetical protein